MYCRFLSFSFHRGLQILSCGVFVFPEKHLAANSLVARDACRPSFLYLDRLCGYR